MNYCRREKVQRIILMFLVGITLLSFTSVGFASSVKDQKNKIKENDEKIKEYKEKIDITNKEIEEVNKELEKLDEEMMEAVEAIEETEKEIIELEEGIKITLEELKEAEKNLEEKNDSFKERLRVMYKSDNLGYIGVLLSSSSIKDFFARKDMIKTIAEHDKELLEYMTEQKNIIELKKLELENQKKDMEDSKRRLESKKEDLEKVTKAKREIIEEKEANLAEYEERQRALEAESSKINEEIQRLTSSTTAYIGGDMNWPVPGHRRISSHYGTRTHPIFKTKKFHSGIDIPAPTGTPIIAVGSGTVIKAGNMGGYGRTVMVDHGGGIVTLYAHNSQLTVSVGQKVSKGDIIAKAGSTGYSTGPHCHFEVRKNGSTVDPLSWLRGK